MKEEEEEEEEEEEQNGSGCSRSGSGRAPPVAASGSSEPHDHDRRTRSILRPASDHNLLYLPPFASVSSCPCCSSALLSLLTYLGCRSVGDQFVHS
eukprot:254561-Hanusia_phi.AAC.1